VPTLAHALVTADGREPSRWMFFLHGILGSGSNWRSFARSFVAARPSWGAVLVDLRLHGNSQGFLPPHTIAACAEDLAALRRLIPGPVKAVLGHSFGGKVALEYLRHDDEVSLAFILDSTPSARPDARGSESTVSIVKLLDELPARFASREAFQEHVTRHGHTREIAMWLAMNVKADDDGGFSFRLDVPGIRALLDDYFVRDEWDVVEEKRAVAMHLVIGDRSTVLDTEDREHARRIAEASGGRVQVHVLPHAGHWVHVDAPQELLALLIAAAPE